MSFSTPSDFEVLNLQGYNIGQHKSKASSYALHNV
jgi:hypothetical protein